MEQSVITRREAVRNIGLGIAGMATVPYLACGRELSEHIISLSFDDGFEKSSIRTAEIYEKYNLSACINVIASAHERQFGTTDDYHLWPVGDFGLWNELQARGHEIMPHTYEHANLTELPLEEAKSLVMKCLEVFSRELVGFEAKESVYNFAYNASNQQIEDWLVTQVKAFRTGGPVFNRLPYLGMTRLTCISYGPDNIDKHLEESINTFLEGPSGWFIYNTHGLDEEGWGPVSSVYLDELLDRLTQTRGVKVLAVGEALNMAG